jgi:hypothetical protein
MKTRAYINMQKRALFDPLSLSIAAAPAIASTAYGEYLKRKPVTGTPEQYQALLAQAPDDVQFRAMPGGDGIGNVPYAFAPGGSIIGDKDPTVYVPGRKKHELDVGIDFADLVGEESLTGRPDIGFVAHELGHAQQPILRRKWTSTFLKLFGAGGGLVSSLVAGFSPAEKPAAIAAILGPLTASPMLWAEVDAAKKGREALEQVPGTTPEQLRRPYMGLPTYALAAAIPSLIYASRKARGRFRKRRRFPMSLFKQSADDRTLPTKLPPAVVNRLWQLSRMEAGDPRKGQGGHDLLRQQAVSDVVLNRYLANKKHYGKTIPDIVHKPSQFSVWRGSFRDNPRFKNVMTTSKIDSPGYKQFQELLSQRLAGKRKDLTQGATHFINPKEVKKLPPWYDPEKFKKLQLPSGKPSIMEFGKAD